MWKFMWIWTDTEFEKMQTVAPPLMVFLRETKNFTGNWIGCHSCIFCQITRLYSVHILTNGEAESKNTELNFLGKEILRSAEARLLFTALSQTYNEDGRKT